MIQGEHLRREASVRFAGDSSVSRLVVAIAMTALALPNRALPCCCAAQVPLPDKHVAPASNARSCCSQPPPPCCKQPASQTRSRGDLGRGCSGGQNQPRPGCDGCNSACCNGKPPYQQSALPAFGFLQMTEAARTTIVSVTRPLSLPLDGLLRPPRS
jgi:hypothetical protein